MRKLLLALPFVMTACGNIEGEAQDPQALDDNLSASYGGTAETDEQPAFGDAVLAAESEDTPAGDTMTDGRPELASARRVRILVVWGYLRPHPAATEVVDWSGSITVANAALRVVRKVRFEQRDLVLRPRTDMQTVAFDSHTRPHADGLVLEVILAPTLNPAQQPVTLTFATAPFTDTLTIEPGMRLTKVVKVDDAEHVVAYHVIRPNDGTCTEGFVRGIWKQRGEVDGRTVGVLKGRFTADEGAITGHVMGVFGERRNGHNVFFAKVVDTSGKFLGVVAGRFGDGKLAGLFLGRTRTVAGVVRGEYRDGDADGDGAFFGRYSQRCGENAAEGQPATGDEPEISLSDPTAP